METAAAVDATVLCGRSDDDTTMPPAIAQSTNATPPTIHLIFEPDRFDEARFFFPEPAELVRAGVAASRFFSERASSGVENLESSKSDSPASAGSVTTNRSRHFGQGTSRPMRLEFFSFNGAWQCGQWIVKFAAIRHPLKR